CWCIAYPAFPAPSLSLGERSCKARARSAPRESEAAFSNWRLKIRSVTIRCVRARRPSNCHHPRKRVIQYSETSVMESERPRRTGCPAFACHDEPASCYVPARSARLHLIRRAKHPRCAFDDLRDALGRGGRRGLEDEGEEQRGLAEQHELRRRVLAVVDRKLFRLHPRLEIGGKAGDDAFQHAGVVAAADVR